MKKIIVLAALAAFVGSGCRAPKTSLNSGNINATLSNSNHVGTAIAAGNQISSMMDKESMLAFYRDVAIDAVKNGAEMSLTAVGHGASKQPNVARESKATEKLTNSLASAIKAAKSGGSDPQALAKFGADLVGGLVELSEEAANPPAADDASLIGFDLKIGPGANIAGVAVSGELARTRIETVKASRSTYSRTVSSDTQESNTPAGIEAIAAAMIAARPPNSPAGVVAGASKPETPAGDAAPPASLPDDGAGGTFSSPAARIAAWYPSASLGGGNTGAGSERSLWKPVSDSSGKLAVHLPHSAIGKIISMTINGETQTVVSVGNGWRPLIRFSKPGAAYSGEFVIKTDSGDWTGAVPGGKRTEPIPMKKVSGTLKVSDLKQDSYPPSGTNSTLGPYEPIELPATGGAVTNNAGDAAAPGEPPAP